MPKRTLYLRLEIEAPADTDPLLDLSAAANWADCRLNHPVDGGRIATQVTAYACAADLVHDEVVLNLQVPA